MAIVLTEANALFVHIPKTGGTWVEHVLHRCGIETAPAPRAAEASVRHATPSQLLGNYRFRFTFVRHPFSWYESWWKYQAGVWQVFEPDVWHPQRVLEPCASDDFLRFVRRCVEREPGYVSRMYEPGLFIRSVRGEYFRGGKCTGWLGSGGWADRPLSPWGLAIVG